MLFKKSAFFVSVAILSLLGTTVAAKATVQGRPSHAFAAPTTDRRLVAEAFGGQASTPTPVDAPRVVALATEEDCRDYHVCFWREDGFSGLFYGFTGNYAPCEGWRFEGTPMQDHTYSFWNRASGQVSVWNRYADGTYRYHKLGTFARGFKDGHRFSYRTDAWVYDPNNDCASLTLHQVRG
ncbi:peptidase inhibitor family I36 protein [Actinosynnema sp. CS-041913]|uniref:peptidase inhibitor family I36 protein n=1 Tax=Actinosynnema sp. CS-041913 TaxID=3239917 RepID=UPI003D8EF6D1